MYPNAAYCECQVLHYLGVAFFPKPNKLVILANDLRSPFGEVQCETALLCPEVIDVEHQLLGQVLRVPPSKYDVSPATEPKVLHSRTFQNMKDGDP